MQAAAKTHQKAGSKEKAALAAAAEDTTLRATQVLGRKVIDSSNALILGYVDEIYFSFETRQIVALRVRAYFKSRLLALLKGHKSRWVVPIQIVHRIGAYAVVIDREQAGIPVDPTRPTEAEKKARAPQKPPAQSAGMHSMSGRKVVSDDGELLGKLADVLLSDDSPLMQGFEILTAGGLRQLFGLGDYTQRLSPRARALGDVLLVPARGRLALTSPSIPAVLPPPAAAEAQPYAPEPAENATPDWLC